MKEDLKLDVAIQVISNRLAEAMKNEDSQKFQRMLEESKLHTFGLNSPATTERKVAVVLAGQIGEEKVV